jgi:hypothetical protein
MARKTVKTAEKRHGGGHKEGADAPIRVKDGAEDCENSGKAPWPLEARGPAMIVEGTATLVLSRGVRAYTSAFWIQRWNITEVQDPSFVSVW